MMSETVSIDRETQDERILAALAHSSVIIPFWGLIGAIVIWATQRETSDFVGFQALQGVVYQLSLILLGFLGGACYMCSFPAFFLTMPIGFAATEGVGDPGGAIGVLLATVGSMLPFCLMGVFVLIGLAFVFYGLYGAVRVLQGHDFRYIWIGARLEQYLSQGEGTE